MKKIMLLLLFGGLMVQFGQCMQQDPVAFVLSQQGLRNLIFTTLIKHPDISEIKNSFTNFILVCKPWKETAYEKTKGGVKNKNNFDQLLCIYFDSKDEGFTLAHWLAFTADQTWEQWYQKQCVIDDFDKRDKYGNLPLHYAALKNHIDIAQRLLTSGEAKGTTLLYQKVKEQDLEGVRLLLNNHARMNGVANNAGMTPVGLAKLAHHGQIVTLLNTYHVEEFTPLHFVLRLKNKDILALFIKHGVDLTLVDYLERTPLHIAIMWRNSKEIIELLLNTGERFNVKDNKGRRPLDLANKMKLDWLIELLKETEIED